jgi:hypothetical protein
MEVGMEELPDVLRGLWNPRVISRPSPGTGIISLCGYTIVDEGGHPWMLGAWGSLCRGEVAV